MFGTHVERRDQRRGASSGCYEAVSPLQQSEQDHWSDQPRDRFESSRVNWCASRLTCPKSEIISCRVTEDLMADVNEDYTISVYRIDFGHRD